MGWPDIKRQARLAVHTAFTWPAVYTPPDVGAVSVPVSVRRHTKILSEGDQNGAGFAVVREDVNRIVFLASEVTPERKGVVEFEDGFRYAIDLIEPHDGEPVIACSVTQVA